ncbi:hypothetical protein M8J77_025912 [Diaphorina citri]|nr:hypothetical protein M8J77_025912 [Diaphorina citri]
MVTWWNFQKANWNKFSKQLDKTLGWILPKRQNYQRFCGAVISTAKKCIPRGYRKEYVPGWNKECEELYEQYIESGEQEIGDELLQTLGAARRVKWLDTVENMDFKKSSRKAWTVLRKLGGGNKLQQRKNPIHPNKIASHIVNVSRTPKDRGHTIDVKRRFKQLKETCPVSSNFSGPVTEADVRIALKDTKPNKAPGFDAIHPEFLLHCGNYTVKWLSKFFSDIIETGNVPNDMKQAKIIALLKPGKDEMKPESYRPISLLSCMYKILERILYNRISQNVHDVTPAEQAGFRPGRNTTDQVLSLTTYIEAGYQLKLKTSVAFIDLSAAFDTVWREGLLFKFLKTIPCMKTLKLLNNMLSNRNFRIIMGDQMSHQKKLNNGLPQGSVLAPLLFNLYLSDIPDTKSKKFGYADDWALATRSENIEETETILTEDLAILHKYYKDWRLKPNATKTEVTCFHLNNQLANRKLNINFANQTLNHNNNPKYLGVVLDRTLSYKIHLKNTAAKLKTRNNIIHKLCGSTWGSSPHVLRSSALGLVYSVAEYCSPVWLYSKHTNLVDVQLNNSMRMITGSIKSTPTFWLPILSNIPPPQLRRESSLLRELQKIQSNTDLPIHTDLEHLEESRLKSRNPALKKAILLQDSYFNISNIWHELWNSAVPIECKNLPCIDSEPPGMNLPRKTWVTLNRIRTNHGICADMMFKWGKAISSQCDCGDPKQSIRHIVQQCPLRRYSGDFEDFILINDDAVQYINDLDIKI